VLCLSHHPEFFPIAVEKGAHLTLSGHTHGGQVAFFGIPAFAFAFKHMLGRYFEKSRHLYVSGGTGHWLPFRLGVPAEVTIVTLRA
jgi:predicted MPP superfamily phosphohydrolase